MDVLSLADVKERLELLEMFLDEHIHLLNAHLVDFIVCDLWESLIPIKIREEVALLSDADWFSIVEMKFRFSFNDDGSTRNYVNLEKKINRSNDCLPSNYNLNSVNLEEFLDFASRCRLDCLLGGSSESVSVQHMVDAEGLAPFLSDFAGKLYFDSFAGSKKQHEVEILADIIAAIGKKQSIEKVVDFGSGKGYLGSFLALQHGFNVFGIDSCKENIKNASKRNERLRKSWSGLVRRATAKAKSCETNAESPDTKSSASFSTSKSGSSGSYVGISEFVDDKTSLEKLLGDGSDRFLLTGLHTCGDLAARTLECYVTEAKCSSVVSVACCYHLIEEEFFRNPFLGTDQVSKSKSGFPMSSFLRERNRTLGRNSRMAACESLDRIVSNRTNPSVSIFYRSILKAIVREKWGEKYENVNVGRLADKTTNLNDYVTKALLKINVPTKEMITESEISSYLGKYSKYEATMKWFCRLRNVVAPAVESILLLDRLCYLYEQNDVKRSYVIRVFDPVVSPRCYAIVSFKDL